MPQEPNRRKQYSFPGHFIGSFLARPLQWPWDPFWQGYEKYRTWRLSPGCEFRHVFLPAETTENLDSWLFLPKGIPQPKTVILLVHGFTISRAEMARPARTFLSQGVACCLVNLPCHGGKGGLCTFGVRESYDLIRAARSLREDYGFQHVVLCGMSLGAATILQTLKADPPVDAIVALAPFATFREVAADYVQRWTLWRRDWLANEVVDRAGEAADYDPEEASPLRVLARTSSQVPVLFVHGTMDGNVPASHTAQLLEAYKGPREVIWVRGAGHYTLMWPRHRKLWMEQVFHFLEKQGVSFCPEQAKEVRSLKCEVRSE